MTSRLPARVDPQPLEPSGPVEDLDFDGADTAREGGVLSWEELRGHLFPAVAQGASRAFVAAWSPPHGVSPTLREVATVTVRAAAAVAQDPAAGSETRVAALVEARRVVETVAATAQQETPLVAGFMQRVLAGFGALAVGVGLLRFIRRE
jgi:hypothetical protein